MLLCSLTMGLFYFFFFFFKQYLSSKILNVKVMLCSALTASALESQTQPRKLSNKMKSII